MSSRSVIRRASHADGWYNGNPSKLDAQLQQWLDTATVTRKPARAIISPHAGYSYSGSCAAFAFKQIDPTNIKRVFVIGPAHYLGLKGQCSLSGADIFETPLYQLSIDKEGNFAALSLDRDEEEHSIEMQMPYVAKIMESRKGMFTVIPVLVGFLTPEEEAMYGQIFAPYLSDPENIFVISSDFCHWGKRFRYTYYDQSKGPIWKSTEALDKMGMNIIESLSPSEFTSYLRQYSNTICGRHPIGILLQTISAMRRQLPHANFSLKFVQYAQSEHCTTDNQSSVSYASGSLLIN